MGGGRLSDASTKFFFFTKTVVTREWKVEKLFPRREMNGLSEGFERAVDQNWSCMAKIHAQENFAKFLISNFLQGLTYSALYGVNNSSAP